MLDVRLLCDTEFVVVVDGLDSVATLCCSLLRTSSQTFSTPPPFCVGGGFACVVLFNEQICVIGKVKISKPFIINRSPDTAETVRPAVSIFNDTVLMLAGLSGTWSGVMMMLLATRRQTFSHWALDGEITSGLWFEMPVVDFHLNNSHELNLPG